ncbi:MAG: endopeptidase La, partial [Methanosphaera sp. rholeuAM270]
MADKDNLSFTQNLRQNNEIITDLPKENTTNNPINTDNELPIIIIPNTLLLPHTDMTIELDKAHTEKILESVNENLEGIILTPKRIPEDENENVEFYDVGVILELKNLQEEEEHYRIELKVKDKVLVNQIIEREDQYYGTFQIVKEETNITEDESIEINKNINDAVLTISNMIPNSEIYAQQIIGKLDTLEKVAEVFPYIKVPLKRKQELLEMQSAKLRALKIVQLLIEQKDAMLLQMDIAKKLNKKMSETHKQSLLREQMKMIQEELQLTDETDDHKTYRERIMEAQLPEEVEKAALEELHKLERQGQNNSEENIIRNYLDTILNLPWHKETNVEIDIIKAREQLDKDHYGLKKVKERIIQHLTVLKMKEEKQGSILLLVGPPGTGKTSLGRSIAEALNRPYVRASLGGIKDESEIRGHRRTYLGALPGRIINGMKKAGKTNPVFVLDEIDKMTASINGNPTSALLEVLDPEQNDSFSDHYLEVPYDLSDVFFIATANSLMDIPEPLRDRLEIIELDS